MPIPERGRTLPCLFVADEEAFNPLTLTSLPTTDHKYVSKEWLKEHIQQGPLGECYPDVAYAMEGDTPSYLGCIPVGAQ